MSNIEPRPEHELSERSTTDPWSIWFSKFIQVFGVAIMAYEAFVEHADRPWLLFCAMGMLLGATGLQAILRWAVRRGLGEM